MIEVGGQLRPILSDQVTGLCASFGQSLSQALLEQTNGPLHSRHRDINPAAFDCLSRHQVAPMLDDQTYRLRCNDPAKPMPRGSFSTPG